MRSSPRRMTRTPGSPSRACSRGRTSSPTCRCGPAAWSGLAENERLEDDTVAVLRHGRPSMTEAARRDFVDFLWDTEQAYWRGMYRFLKDELGVKSLVSGTQLSYSPPSIQAELDYIDAHAYWNHPDFPGRPWDANNWTVTQHGPGEPPGRNAGGPGRASGRGQGVHRERVQPSGAERVRRRGLSDDRGVRRVSAVGRRLLVRLLPQRSLRAATDRGLLRHQERHGQARPHARLRRHVPPRATWPKPSKF